MRQWRKLEQARPQLEQGIAILLKLIFSFSFLRELAMLLRGGGSARP